MEEFKYIFKKEKRKKERESRLWRSLEKYEVCFFFLGQGGGGGWGGSLSNQVSISGVFKKMICNQAIPLPKF